MFRGICKIALDGDDIKMRKFSSAVPTDDLDKGEEQEAGKSPWADLSNPIRPILAKLKRQSVDNKYLEVGSLDGNIPGSEPSSARYKVRYLQIICSHLARNLHKFVLIPAQNDDKCLVSRAGRYV